MSKSALKDNPTYQALVEVLGSEKKAKKAHKRLAAQVVEEAPAKSAKEAAKEEVAEFVSSQGFSFTRGRVYVTGTVIEAQARVLRTGKAEIVRTSGVGRTKAVLVTREESGDVALQNLTEA